MQPLDGRHPVQLTSGPGPDEGPSVARDGTIAFANSRFRNVLSVYQLASGQTRELLAHSSYLWAPAFSPDDREVAFSREEVDGSWHIWIAPVDGGTVRRLTSGAIPEVYPRFSPDGATIVARGQSNLPDTASGRRVGDAEPGGWIGRSVR